MSPACSGVWLPYRLRRLAARKEAEMHKITIASLLVALASASAAAAAQGTEAPLAVKATDASIAWGACPPIFPGACEIAVLRGDPAQPNADVLLRVAPGYELPRHKHTSAERMVLLEGELRVQYDGAEVVTLTPATYAYGPAGLPHEAKCISQTHCSLFIAFEGPVDADPVAALTAEEL
jgi:quercetin dioxygenase-like cupin family protein